MDKRIDVVIVGAGLAGTYLALNLPEHLNIVMLSSHDDNSSLAQGGIASCIRAEDSFNAHIEDTLIAGHFANNIEAVTSLVTEAPEHIKKLQELGVVFDTDARGRISATLEGGHSGRRVLHIDGDQTGKGIMRVLRQQLHSHDNIEVIYNANLIELLTDGESGAVAGVIYERDHGIHAVSSQFVVMATGGMGNLYEATTNHPGSYGTGIAIAKEAGAKTKDLHYMQFHPTAYYSNTKKRYFLISEALRGEGAHLLDHNLRRFMPEVDDRAELAPRDIVAKAIFERMSLSRKNYVFLDTRHLSTDFLRERFPAIFAHLSKQGLTLGKDLIPVTPVAHYTVGGIMVDNNGMSTVEGLYACGEAASTGVHGANRLASNSLLECLVYGQRVADAIAEIAGYDKMPEDRMIVWPECNRSIIPTSTSGSRNYISDIQKLTTRFTGIKRTDEGLCTAKRRLSSLMDQLAPLKYCTMDTFHAYHMASLAIQVINDAMANDSLGCHSKENTRKEQLIC